MLSSSTRQKKAASQSNTRKKKSPKEPSEASTARRASIGLSGTGSAYIAIIRRTDSAFSVDFPDFPGCISGGDTLHDAAANASDALRLHARGLIEDGDPLPAPSDLSDVIPNIEGDEEDAITTVVFLPAVEREHAVRVNITVDASLLAAIDERAERIGVSRSKFLADAAKDHLR